ncbi:MAG TPA: glutamate-5-semialdehyde dehydrogenase, partial [Micromonospora sp.]
MTDQLLTDAHAALRAAPPVGDPAYQRYCAELAEQLTGAWHLVRKANAEDVAAAEARGLPAALVDRLRLTDTHLAALVRLTRTVADELPAATAPGPEIPVG